LAIIAAVVGVVLIMVILWEGFEIVVLPRRVTRRLRLSRLFFRSFWYSWRTMIDVFIPKKSRETWLSFFGPLSNLFILTVWVIVLIVSFALLHWATGSTVRPAEGNAGFFTDLYLSGTTFFTLGLGDVIPLTNLSRFLVAVESGMGFAFLALVISYIPALNTSLARREVSISLLDARAGSPPSAAEMLRRHTGENGLEALRKLLEEWEKWSAELLESHLSYPVLAYYRSQHDNESWLGALTTILDTCSLITVSLEGICTRQAKLTFAIARHAVVDLSLVFKRPPQKLVHDRLPPEALTKLHTVLTEAGLKMNTTDAAGQQLAELRETYEPYVNGLALFFRMNLPPWVLARPKMDNWQVSAWEPAGSKLFRKAGTGKGEENEHF
jgi:hypothetical protein